MYTRQRKRQQERAHTLHVTALEFTSVCELRSVYQERHSEKICWNTGSTQCHKIAYACRSISQDTCCPGLFYTGSDTGLSQRSSALLPALAVCECKAELTNIQQFGFANVDFFARNFEFWAKKSIISTKNPIRCVLRREWRGLVGWLLICATVRHVCHAKKISASLDIWLYHWPVNTHGPDCYSRTRQEWPNKRKLTHEDSTKQNPNKKRGGKMTKKEEKDKQ